eukprot:gene22679-27632_t
MNPHYSLTLLLILYYLRKEIIKTKHQEFTDKQQELLDSNRKPDEQQRLLKRIERFNHRFSLYNTPINTTTTTTTATKAPITVITTTTPKKKEIPTRIKFMKSSSKSPANARPSNMLSSFDADPDDIRRHSIDNLSDSDGGIDVDDDEGFQSEEEEDVAISQQLFGERKGLTNNVAQKKPFTPTTSLQPERGGEDQVESNHSDPYQEYLRSNSSEELRKE